MNVKTLYKKDEEITLKSYLNKHNITDIDEYLLPTGKYLDNCLSYENMREAVQNFKWHYLQKDPAYILCDGDCDGITSTCIMYQYMKLLNPQWSIKILLHENKERGLGDDLLYERILKEPRPLVIIPDAGSNDCERARILNENNITLLIFDHHNIQTPIDTGVLVNNQVGNVDKNGSGCLVTHKFLQALDLEFNVKYSSQFVDMVALSIISDSMDITSMQNRTYLYYGLFSPNPLIKNEFLKALINRFIFRDNFTIRDIAFKIVPKINAICRCGEQEIKQRLILAFLGMTDIDEVLDICEEYHQKQMEYVKKFVDNHVDNVDNSNNIVILESNDLKPSYSGLIAGKLEDIFNKPCIVGKEKDGVIVGSLRSPIPLAEKINETGLAEMHGHSQASGAFLPIGNIDKLYKFMDTVDIHYQPEIEVLQSYLTSEIPNELFGEFNGYNLWDTKYMIKPLFCIKDIRIKGKNITIMGKKENTIKFTYKGLEFIYFGITKANKEKLHIGKNISLNLEVLAELNINIWGNKKTKQVIIQDMEVKEYEQRIDDLF